MALHHEQRLGSDRDGGERSRLVDAARSHAALRNKKENHRNGLREFSFEIPARGIASVREQGMNAHGSLLRLDRIDGVFGFVSFFVDGKDAERGNGLQGVAGLWMHHAHVKRDKVSGVDKRRSGDDRN
ncbi:MAG: hypothetical protein WCD34_11565 [Candidatus Acidiferrum sp.]